MRRFFINPENITGSTAILTDQEAHHISKVLRLTTGTTVTLFDGSGSFFEARLTKISPAGVEAKIVAITPYIEENADTRPHLHLAVGLLKGKKMDLIIQKITELGIEGLHPFRSRYCAAPDPAAGRFARWQKIAYEACKQCNRPKPPHLYDVADFSDILSLAREENHDLKLIFWEEGGNRPLRDIVGAAPAIQSALVVVGPEGGFSPEEIAAAGAAGLQTATLGKRILRAETAAIAAASILQYELGNLD